MFSWKVYCQKYSLLCINFKLIFSNITKFNHVYISQNGFKLMKTHCTFQVDGAWSEWGNWGSCPVTCGAGSQQRTRTCVYPVLTAPHGAACFGNRREEKGCNSISCPGTYKSFYLSQKCVDYIYCIFLITKYKGSDHKI